MSLTFLILLFGKQAKAEWEFPSYQGYLLSVPTPTWGQSYYADSMHSYISDNVKTDNAQVMQLGTGDYWAIFPGLGFPGPQGSAVQVTAFGAGNPYCKVAFWGLGGADYNDINVRVHCFNSSGQPNDSLFTVNYVKRVHYNEPYPDGPEMAYVWANDPSNQNYDASNTGYAWNSTGMPITIRRLDVGSYRVTLGQQTGGVEWRLPTGGDCQPDNGGTVEVTAYGDGSSFCNANGLPKNRATNPSLDPDTSIDVKCINGATGAAADTMFDLVYSTMSPNGTQSGGFAAAIRPDLDNYTADTRYARQFIDTSDGITCPHCYTYDLPYVANAGVGLYNVTFPFIAFNWHTIVNVTTFAPTGLRCKVSDWWALNRPAGLTGTVVQVACYRSDGSPLGSKFYVNLSNQEFIDQ